jgi:hypothetical protein
MSKVAGVIQLSKKEHDRLSRELRGLAAALAAFGPDIRQECAGPRALCVRLGRGLRLPKQRVGKSYEDSTLGGCTAEDCSGQRGSWGQR